MRMVGEESTEDVESILTDAVMVNVDSETVYGREMHG